MRHLQSKPLGLETKMEPATLCRLLFSVEEATVASLACDGCFEGPQNDINKGLKVKT